MDVNLKNLKHLGSQLQLTRAVTTCMNFPAAIQVSTLVQMAKGYENQGKIGNLNLLKKKTLFQI
jgi:hypothetical protein